MKFTVVCTDLDTGKPVYHECPNGDVEDIEWMRASASIPIASRPVKLEGKRLLDGGVSIRSRLSGCFPGDTKKT